jgi:hypothetical protein
LESCHLALASGVGLEAREMILALLWPLIFGTLVQPHPPRLPAIAEKHSHPLHS